MVILKKIPEVDKDLTDIKYPLHGRSYPESFLRRVHPQHIPVEQSDSRSFSVSTGPIAAAFPGRSTFIWVPAAMKSSTITIVAGLKPAAAKLVFLPLPYLSLNPPGRDGNEKRVFLLSDPEGIILGLKLR